MSEHNLHTFNIHEETTTLSTDSLECEQTTHGIPETKDVRDGFNCSLNSGIDSPSFHNILSSSHCDVASRITFTFAGSVETYSQHYIGAGLFKEDEPRRPGRPPAVAKCIEITEENKLETQIVTDSPAEHAVSKPKIEDEDTGSPPCKTAAKSESERGKVKPRADHHSRIPIAVKSLPAIARLRQNIEKCPTLAASPTTSSEPQAAAAAVDDTVDATVDVGKSPHTDTPKAVERCRSHHTIDRAKRDFIQLNKQGDFRRTKTYHSLYLERHDSEKRSGDATAAPTAVVASEILAETDTGTDTGVQEAVGESASAADAAEDQTLPSGRSPGGGISPLVSLPDHSSPAAGGGETSGGRRDARRSISRIPVRAGTTRRRHQSHESPRDHVLSHVSRRDHVSNHVSRKDCHVFGRDLKSDSHFEFHESRLSYDNNSEIELLVPRLELTHSQTVTCERPVRGLCDSQFSLIDVNDNRRLLSEVSSSNVSAASLQHRKPGRRRGTSLILLDDSTSSASLQHSPRQVHVPPDRTPMPHRRVHYEPKLTPYPRQYVNLGKLGPDPEAVKARQEKMQKQQEYAEQVTKKNRTVVKPKSHQYSKPQETTKSAHDKMVSYAKTVPKPKQKPKSPRARSPTKSREVSPMSKIRKLLAENSLSSGKVSSERRRSQSSDASPVHTVTNMTSSEAVTSGKPPQCGSPSAERRPWDISAPSPGPAMTPAHAPGHALPPVSLSLPAFEAPPTCALPPRDSRRRRSVQRRAASPSAPPVTQARVVSSLSRLRSLTTQLVTGPMADDVATWSHGVQSPVRSPPRSPTARGPAVRSPALGSDLDSDCSVDSLSGGGGTSGMTSPHRAGSTSPRGRGLFPPSRDVPAARRPIARCSRGVGTQPPGAESHFVAEDFFLDPCGGHGACGCGGDSCSPHRRPMVTRGTQSVAVRPGSGPTAHPAHHTARSTSRSSVANETFVIHTDPMVVDIGMPAGGQRRRTGSPRTRLGALQADWRPSHDITPGGEHHETPAAALHSMRQRHITDKRRVDAILSGASTRM